MKKEQMKKKAFLCAGIALMMTLLITSCGRKKVRKNIEGKWGLTEYTLNETPFPGTVSGTWEFLACDGSNNKKNSCTMNQFMVIEYMGVSDTTMNELNWSIIKGDVGENQLLLDEAIFDIVLTDTKLEAYNSEDGETVKLTFNKQ